MSEIGKSNYHHYIFELEANKEVFRFMLADMPESLHVWKPDPGELCALEVLCLLLDEEKEGFRTKIRQVLEELKVPLAEIRQDLWLNERAYMEQNFQAKLQDFLFERENSLEWLKSLEKPDWKYLRNDPVWGSVSTEMVLTDWLANDYLRIRQILHLKFMYVRFLPDNPGNIQAESSTF
jgi:hypothetical protein